MRKRLFASLFLLPALLLLAAAAQAALSPYQVQKIKDAVVLIDVTLTLPNDDVSEASGSGFVIAADGQIVTNNHVVAMEVETATGGTVRAKSREVKVIFHPATEQEKSYTAQVLRQNHELDLALLKVQLVTPVFLELADSEAIPETAAVYVCGHPLGLREISIRSGSVTAKRTWEGRRYLEHDAMAEGGNSGGPVVDADARVVGIHTLTLTQSNAMTKFAIPSNVLRDWLRTDPAQDPAPVMPGAEVKRLLDVAKLHYEDLGDGVFDLPYDNDITVSVHKYEDFLRAFVPLGELPGEDAQEQGKKALAALRFNYTDPVGRLSVWNDEGTYRLYWEAQIPFSAVSPEYLKTLGRCGANQAERWNKLLAGEEAGEPGDLYPGGDEQEQYEALRGILEHSGLKFEDKEGYFKLPYDNEVNVLVSLIEGMVWTHVWVGGMPGEGEIEQGQKAILLLQRNWDDAFGRLSLDDDNDVIWESQVPLDFLTPDYLAILCNSCASQAADYKQEIGDIPLNGGE